MVKADVNFINGNIYTMKNEGDKIEAFSVQNGKIIAAGTEAKRFQPKRLLTSRAKQLFLECRTPTAILQNVQKERLR